LERVYFFLVPHPLLAFLGAVFDAGADFAAGFASVFFFSAIVVSPLKRIY